MPHSTAAPGGALTARYEGVGVSASGVGWPATAVTAASWWSSVGTAPSVLLSTCTRPCSAVTSSVGLAVPRHIDTVESSCAGPQSFETAH